MLHLITASKKLKKLETGEIIKYITIPDVSYEELKTDFEEAQHLSVINTVDLLNAKGIIVKTNNVEDGLLAATYIIKRYEFLGLLNEEDYDDYEKEDEEDYDEDFPPGDEPYDYKADNFLSPEHLPIITADEFSSAYISSYQPFNNGIGGIGPFQTQWSESNRTKTPYWLAGNYPLIVIEEFKGYVYQKPIDAFKQAQRFIIYISIVPSQFEELYGQESTNQIEKRVTFECDYEVCRIGTPTKDYLQIVLNNSAITKGYKLSKTIDKAALIDHLKRYRGINFSNNLDIELLVNKAIRKKEGNSKTLNKSDFAKIIDVIEVKENLENAISSSAYIELDELIGLHDAKDQLKRMIARLKFDKKRRGKGYITSTTHLSAIFMGSPGTAKTTVARIFANILRQEGVLDNEAFFEVSRKDLVGKYVGWTAPTVAKLFEDAKGGTIFIDEAYSLLTDGNADNFSDEALSEIIRQMENNPDTLVIFAGYTDKMKNFILNANPGLRSRLTNIIEFNDYTNEELFKIFTYLLEKENYKLNDHKLAQRELNRLIDQLKKLDSDNIGNGRLMRKVFKSAVSYMAEREDNDLETLAISDIKNAIREIYAAETIISKGKEKTTIGFSI